MTPAVEIEGVTKTFGPQVAVDDLSLVVPSGTIYGFIGPNGSGKTTTLRMIMRIFLPDRGNVRVLGDESWKAAADRVTYLPEERGLYKAMKVREVIRFYAELKGMRQPQKRIEDWLERMELAHAAEKRVDQLSKGMSQKVQFITAVVTDPDLIILDEPFSGLDPVNENLFRKAILDLKKAGRTLIFSTHNMTVAEQLCDFVFMIYRGKKVLDGTLDSIQDVYGFDTIRARVDGASLEGLAGVDKVTDFGRYQELRLSRGSDSQAILRELMHRGTVRQFEQTRPSLHDIFVRIADPKDE